MNWSSEQVAAAVAAATTHGNPCSDPGAIFSTTHFPQNILDAAQYATVSEIDSSKTIGVNSKKLIALDLIGSKHNYDWVSKF